MSFGQAASSSSGLPSVPPGARDPGLNPSSMSETAPARPRSPNMRRAHTPTMTLSRQESLPVNLLDHQTRTRAHSGLPALAPVATKTAPLSSFQSQAPRKLTSPDSHTECSQSSPVRLLKARSVPAGAAGLTVTDEDTGSLCEFGDFADEALATVWEHDCAAPVVQCSLVRVRVPVPVPVRVRLCADVSVCS